MKKAFLFLTALLMMVGNVRGQAQTIISDLNQLSDKDIYFIKSQRCFLLAKEGEDGLFSSNGTSAGSPVEDHNDPKQQFRIIKDGSNYYLFNQYKGQFVVKKANSKDGQFSDSKAEALSFVDLSGDYWQLKLGEEYLNSQDPNQTGLGLIIDGWSQEDGGNRYTIYKVNEDTYTPIYTRAKTRTNRRIGSFSVNGDTYTLTDEEQLQTYVDKSTKEFVVEPGSTVTLEMTQSEGTWMNAFVYVDTDKNGFTAGIASDNYTPTGDLVSYSFYNQGYSDDSNGRNSAGTTINGGNRSTLSLPSFTAPSEPGTYRMRAKYDWCNINPDGVISSYYGNTFLGHGAAIIDFTLVVESLPEIEARYRVSDMTGQTYEGDFVYNTVNHPEFEGAKGITFDNINWDEEQSLYQATIDFGFPVSNEKSGTLNEVLLDIHNKGKYLRNVGDDVKVSSNTPDASCSWGIYPIFDEENESFTFKIRNVATGKYLCTNATGAVHNTQGTVFLSNSATLFTNPSVRDFKVVDKDLYLSINSPGSDNDVYLGVYGNVHDGTHLYAEDIQSYNVTITDAKYATFFAPVAVTIPDGVTAYTVQVDGEWAILNEVSGTIPSYTGVVLYAETANTYTFNVSSEFLYPIEGNELYGTIASEYISTPSYVLSKQDDVVALYKAELNKDATGGEGNTHFLNNHHKAYLPVPTAQGVKAFYFNFGGETTGIETLVPATDVNAPIYDLSGRRVLSTVKGGVYIQNGKKFIVK